jgi:eukaryotic-like serine/threonine-protein kinase
VPRRRWRTAKFISRGSKLHGPRYPKSDGTPNYEVAFTGDFYDDIVIGVYKMFAVGTILASPVIVDSVIYVDSTDGNLYALQ